MNQRDLEIAEEAMAAYRNAAGKFAQFDAHDLAGILRCLESWAHDTGYTLSWRIFGDEACIDIIADSTNR